jgi:hypothetical protein
VKEDHPSLFYFRRNTLVSDGPPNLFNVTIYCDRTGRLPVIHPDVNVEQFAELTADLSKIPTVCLHKEQGWDGKLYYDIQFSIEVTYLSASTKYEFIYEGKLII